MDGPFIESVFVVCDPFGLSVLGTKILLLVVIMIGVVGLFHGALRFGKETPIISLLVACMTVPLIVFFDRITDGWDGCPSALNQPPYNYNSFLSRDQDRRIAILYPPQLQPPVPFLATLLYDAEDFRIPLDSDSFESLGYVTRVAGEVNKRHSITLSPVEMELHSARQYNNSIQLSLSNRGVSEEVVRLLYAPDQERGELAGITVSLPPPVKIRKDESRKITVSVSGEEFSPLSGVLILRAVAGEPPTTNFAIIKLRYRFKPNWNSPSLLTHFSNLSGQTSDASLARFSFPS